MSRRESIASRLAAPLDVKTLAELAPAESVLPVRAAVIRTGSALRAMALSRDGVFALTGGVDGLVRLWATDSGFELRTFGMFAEPPAAVAFSFDGQLAAAVGGEGDGFCVRVWDVETGVELRRFVCATAPADLVFTPDGGSLVGGTVDYLRRWSLAEDKETFALQMRDDPEQEECVRRVSLHRDGVVLAACAADVRVLDLDTGRLRQRLHGDAAPCAVTLDKDGLRGIVGWADGKVSVFDVLSGESQALFCGHRRGWRRPAIVGVTWMAAERVLSLSSQGEMCLWDVRGAKLLKRVWCGGRALGLARPRDRSFVLVGGANGELHTRNLK